MPRRNQCESKTTARSGAAVALILAFTLAACGGGGGADTTGGAQPVAGSPPTPGAPAPTVSLSAAPTTVAQGGSTVLTWSSSNASSCAATGAWSGTKATSGNQTIAAISSTSTYTLTCTGSGGSTTRSATVNVTGAPAPTVSLSAAPTTVAPGGSTLLTWSSNNASGCAASGAWSGAKATSGNETINSISTASTYTLTCSGGGGSATRAVTVNVTGTAGVSGTVDSSLLNRHQESANLVYAFPGFNTTSGTPAATVPMMQDAGACTFRYALTGLANGNYTVALTSDGGATFKRSANVTVAGAVATQAFAPTRVVQVGPTRQFTHPNQVAGVVSDGDVVEIDAGVYNGPATSWVTSNLTLRGVGGRAHIVAPAIISNGKGIWVTQGANTAVENIEFSGAAVDSKNGAGIRAEGRDLAICGSYFHDNENGILGANGGNGNILIEYSEFARNGGCPDGFGCSHNMYIGHTDRFTLRYSYSHHAQIGHTVKSRALENYILYNRIMDEADGTSSYNIDLPDGGLAYIVGNLLQQSPFTDNPDMLAYGAESLSNPNRTLYVVNNTFVNDKGSGAFISVAPGATATVQNNLFVGNGTPVGGTATQVSNLRTNTPNFVNIGAFDYRPTAATPGIDQGTAPGLGGTFSLTPIYQYVHPTNREARPARNAIDIGAYEFIP